jgi:hypothetical protein
LVSERATDCAAGTDRAHREGHGLVADSQHGHAERRRSTASRQSTARLAFASAVWRTCGRDERPALYVGLWRPTLPVIADALERYRQ